MKNLLLIAVTILAVGCGKKDGRQASSPDESAEQKAKSLSANNPLTNAVRKGDIKAVRKHLDDGADVNIGNPLNIVIEAKYEGRAEIVKLLLAKGSDVNLKNERGWTPAESLKRTAGAMMLVGATDSQKAGNTKIAALLLQHGAKTDDDFKHWFPSAEKPVEDKLTANEVLEIANQPHQPIVDIPQLITAKLKVGMWERETTIDINESSSQKAKIINRRSLKRIKHVNGKYVVVQTYDEKGKKVFTEVHSYNTKSERLIAVGISATGKSSRMIGIPDLKKRSIKWVKQSSQSDQILHILITCSQDGKSFQIKGSDKVGKKIIASWAGIAKWTDNFSEATEKARQTQNLAWLKGLQVALYSKFGKLGYLPDPPLEEVIIASVRTDKYTRLKNPEFGETRQVLYNLLADFGPRYIMLASPWVHGGQRAVVYGNGRGELIAEEKYQQETQKDEVEMRPLK